MMNKLLKHGLIILLIILFVALISYSVLGMIQKEGFGGIAQETINNMYNASVVFVNNTYSIVVTDSNNVQVATFYSTPVTLATMSNITIVTFVGDSSNPLWSQATATIAVDTMKKTYTVTCTLTDKTVMVFVGPYTGEESSSNGSSSGSSSSGSSSSSTTNSSITSTDVINALQKWGPQLIQLANSINPPMQTSSSMSGSTNYENYNHYNGSSYPTVFYGPNGGTAKIMNAAGSITIVLTDSNGKTMVYYAKKGSSSNEITQTTYYGSNGGTATVTTGSNGQYIVKVVRPDGTTTIYYPTNSNQPNDPSSSGQHPTPKNWQSWVDWYNQGSGQQNSSQNSSNEYSNYLPQGVPAAAIPSGNEDLYILKSEVVPPVCPACPTANCPSSNKKCPPCPACARCPEPSFECKKVPNYNSINDDLLPQAVLSGYSTFGM